MNFDLYVFEVPVEFADRLDDVWLSLYLKPLRFNNYQAFRANSFSVGYGQVQMWDKIGDLLRAAGTVMLEKTAVLLTDGGREDVPVKELEQELTVFYMGSETAIAGTTVGPGRIELRLKAERISGSRGVCKLTVQPVFTPKKVRRLDEYFSGSSEFVFSSMTFDLKMSAGDFFFLGPEKYTTDEVTLGSLFFWRGGLREMVRTYLVVCTGIVD